MYVPRVSSFKLSVVSFFYKKAISKVATLHVWFISGELVKRHMQVVDNVVYNIILLESSH